MPLPAITTEEVSAVKVKLLYSSDDAYLFELIEGVVSLKSTSLEKITQNDCLNKTSIDLSFSLNSQVLGENVQSITISIS